MRADLVCGVQATRTYQVAGITIAQRTSGALPGLYWLTPDPVGTVGLQINVATGVVTRRWMDPFGNPRGQSVAWPSPLGFLNAPESGAGLTQLGARAYDSALGMFVSVDPLLDTSEPRHANAYSYAMHSPVSYSDADGLRPIIQPPPGGGRPYTPAPRPAPSNPGGHWNPSPPSAGNDPMGDIGSAGPAQEQWWNPTTWSNDTWRGIGAVASGVAVSVGIGLAAVGGGACVVFTAGVCAVVIAGVAGAAGAVVTYNLATDPDDRTAEGLLSTAAFGAAAGAAAGVAGTLIAKALSGTAAAASGGSALSRASEAALRAAEDPASIFIKNKHLASAGGNGAKFSTDDISQVQGWISRGLQSDGVQFLPNQLDDTFRAVVPGGGPIGTRGQEFIRVIVTGDGRVINAFPVNVR